MNRFNFGNTVTAVRRKVVLGNPKKDCDHLGICYVTDDNEPPSPGFRTGCPQVSGVFSVNFFGQLRITLAKKDLTPSLRRQHFSADKFIVVEPFVFPTALVERFGYQGVTMTIRPGRYDWVEGEQGIMISIPLLITHDLPDEEITARPQVPAKNEKAG